jgi:omega-6 fatty acid desaturase (delta-12 desaturase)
VGWWGAALAALLLAALLRVRLFILFHDCTHHSFFGVGAPSLNRVVGTTLGALCFTSYAEWREGHAFHHRHSNNLNEQQMAQSAPWTTRHWHSATHTERMYACVGCTHSPALSTCAL